MRQTNIIFENRVKTVVDGVEVTGTYELDIKGSYMTVHLDRGGSKNAVAGPDAKGVAELILAELYGESLRRTHTATSNSGEYR